MPITRRQFDMGINDAIEGWMKKAIEFLAEHREEAFNNDELWEILYGIKTYKSRDREAFDLALMRLVDQEKLEIRIIQNTNYYCYKKPLKKFIERLEK